MEMEPDCSTRQWNNRSEQQIWNILELVISCLMVRLWCLNSKSSKEFKFYFIEKSKQKNREEEAKELLEVKILHEVPIRLFQFSKGNELAWKAEGKASGVCVCRYLSINHLSTCSTRNCLALLHSKEENPHMLRNHVLLHYLDMIGTFWTSYR